MDRVAKVLKRHPLQANGNKPVAWMSEAEIQDSILHHGDDFASLLQLCHAKPTHGVIVRVRMKDANKNLSVVVIASLDAITKGKKLLLEEIRKNTTVRYGQSRLSASNDGVVADE